MSDFFFYIIFGILLLFIELLYFRIASANKIIDKPNERSSHSKSTIRGGGIIFPIAVSFWFILNHFQYPIFFSGLILISFISFIDDVKSLDNRIRSIFHLVSVSLMFYEITFHLAWYWYIPLCIVVIGFVNIYNFMDGINGITGVYSLNSIATLWYINSYIIHFISSEFLVFVILGLLIFIFFNFRNKAKCFAGDVGSVSIAFVISFLVINLMALTKTYIFIALVFIYGLDAVSTIIFRLIRKENIFEAHRSHFYQFLANEKQWPHLLVSMLYSSIQLILNIFIIDTFSKRQDNLLLFCMFFLISSILFIIIRLKFEGYNRLLKLAKGA